MQPPRCDACFENALFQLRPMTRARGEDWARAVAAKHGLGRPWPRYEGDAAAAARKRVVDLERRDERIVDALARDCHAWAAHQWALLGKGR